MDLKQSLLQVKILHGALFAGIVLFVGVCIAVQEFINMSDQLAVLPEQSVFLILLIAAALLFLSNFFYKKRTAVIEKSLSLEERLHHYRTAALLRVALIETAALSVGIGYLLSGDMIYLLIMAIPLVYFVYTFPKDEVMIQVLELSYMEQQQLA